MRNHQPLLIINQNLGSKIRIMKFKKSEEQSQGGSAYSVKIEQIEVMGQNGEFNPNQKKIIYKPKPNYYKAKGVPGTMSGEWTLEQNTKYLKFIQKNKQWSKREDLRRKKKIFVRMQKVIKSRTANQCRSHHQKYTQKYPDLESLIKDLKIKIQKQREAQKNQILKVAQQTADRQICIKSPNYSIMNIGASSITQW